MLTLRSLSAHVFETQTATGSELFSLLTYLHTTEFALPSIFSPLEMFGIKIWETLLSWHAKCPLPVVVRVSKTCVLKLPIDAINYVTNLRTRLEIKANFPFDQIKFNERVLKPGTPEKQDIAKH